MTTALKTLRWRNASDPGLDRIGFKAKGIRGRREDLKAHCAKLGRMDLYRSFDALALPFEVILKVANIAAGVRAGNVTVEVLENYAARLAAAVARGFVGNKGNARYEQRARNSARATISTPSAGSCRKAKAEQALALPDLFPDD